MTVKEARMTLSNMYHDDEEIIIAWWGKDTPLRDTIQEVNGKSRLVPWETQVNIIDNKMDWSGTYADMGTCVDVYMDKYWTEQERRRAK